MRPETLGLLTDMRDAAQHIARATAGVTYEGFLNDQDKRQSVLFSFSIIGEAATDYAGSMRRLRIAFQLCRRSSDCETA